MNQIITISREFGSGGRELGKRLAETMGLAYYDYEIIKGIADKSGLALTYVNSIVEHHMTEYYPIRVGRSFTVVNKPVTETAVFKAQSELIKELAEKEGGVFIGRCADYILRERRPVRIMVYADLDSRLLRCREKAKSGERLSDEEMRRQIIAVDKRRSRYYEQYTGQKWGVKENFDLCINTSGVKIKEIIPGLVEYKKGLS